MSSSIQLLVAVLQAPEIIFKLWSSSLTESPQTKISFFHCSCVTVSFYQNGLWNIYKHICSCTRLCRYSSQVGIVQDFHPWQRHSYFTVTVWRFQVQDDATVITDYSAWENVKTLGFPWYQTENLNRIWMERQHPSHKLFCCPISFWLVILNQILI